MRLFPFPGQVPWSDISPWLGKPSQTFLQYMSSLDRLVRPIGSQGGAPRSVLSAPTSFYFDTASGSDSNAGTSASPWQSPAPLAQLLDFGNQTVTLNLKNNPTGNQTVNVPSWVGGGALIIDGGSHTFNTTNADNISTANAGILPGPVTLKNFIFGSTTSGSGIVHLCYGKIILGSGLVFGACPNSFHIRGGAFAEYQKQGNFTISGSAAAHILMGIGLFDGETFITTDTITGGPTFNNFFVVDGSGATCLVDGVTYPATGTYQTGFVGDNGILHAGGRTLPGNGTVVKQSGGQFT